MSDSPSASFSKLNTVPLCVSTALCLPGHLSMDTWVVGWWPLLLTVNSAAVDTGVGVSVHGGF